jgi:hypothetical protein
MTTAKEKGRKRKMVRSFVTVLISSGDTYTRRKIIVSTL